MKFNQKGFASGVLAAIVTLLVVGGLLFYIEKYGNAKTATIVGWKSYTSNQYDFSVEYPPNYTLVDNGSYLTISPDTGSGSFVISPLSLNGVSVFDQGHSDLIPGCKIITATIAGRTARTCSIENSNGFMYHARVADTFSTKWDSRNEVYFSVSLTKAGMTEDLYHQILQNYERILSTLKLGTINT